MLHAKALLEFLNLLRRPWPGLRKAGFPCHLWHLFWCMSSLPLCEASGVRAVPGHRQGRSLRVSEWESHVPAARGHWPQWESHVLAARGLWQRCHAPLRHRGLWLLELVCLSCSNRLSHSKRSGWGAGVLGWWLVLSPVPPEKLRGRGEQVPLFPLSPS